MARKVYGYKQAVLRKSVAAQRNPYKGDGNLCMDIGVRDLVARGYFIPGGASQRGGGQAPCFRVARCQTWTILDSGQSPVMSHRDGF